MSKRRYTNMQVLTTDHRKDVRIRKSHREIEANLAWRRPSGSQSAESGNAKAAKVRRSFVAGSLQRRCREYKYENKRLKMEVKLLQDFLQSTEKGSEAKGKTPSFTVTGRIPNICYVQILRGIRSGYYCFKSVWERRIAMLLWQRKSRNVSAGQIRPMAIDVYGSG